MYHINTEKTRDHIIDRLGMWGIDVDAKSGQILGYTKQVGEVRCRSLYLLRHAETYGTMEKRFMSDESTNSILTQNGIKDVELVASRIEKMKFDCVLYSSITRVKQTAEIVQQQINSCSCYIELPWMKGIDNAGWEGKTAAELKKVDREDFYQREVIHNIFAKSSRGCSWGEVFLRCIDLIKFLNSNYADRRVLLISQGSILIGIKIILQLEDELWKGYDSESFFGLTNDKINNYGKLKHIFGEEIMI